MLIIHLAIITDQTTNIIEIGPAIRYFLINLDEVLNESTLRTI